MTLVLVTIMAGIVTVVLSQSERVQNLGEMEFVRASALLSLSSLETQLPSMLSKIESAEDLDMSMRLPIVMESNNGDFSLNAQLSSMYSKLNINRLLKSDGSIDEAAVAVWMKIFHFHPIADPEMLLKLVLDTIDTDQSERATDTEIIWNDSDFKNGAIKDKELFAKILERYILLSGDRMVLNVPWDDYIGYEGDKIDINAVTPQTLMLLAPAISSEKAYALSTYRTKAFTSKEEVLSAEPALGSVFDQFLFVYSPGSSYTLQCNVSLSLKSRTERIRFDYNLLDKKMRHVEFL